MSVKFSVGVSDEQEDRLLLEELRRQRPSQTLASAEEELETRRPGWPLRAVSEDEPEQSQPFWAW